METFGERLVAARKKKNITQKHLSEILNITPTRLNYWEKDKRKPDIEMIKQIANALDVQTDELLGVEQIREDLKQIQLREEYFKSLGFSIEYQVTKWHHGEIIEEPNIREQIVDDAVYILTKGEHSATFTAEEFEKLQADAKEVIEGVFYKKVMQQQSIK